jgi:hypothetical protein
MEAEAPAEPTPAEPAVAGREGFSCRFEGCPLVSPVSITNDV